MTSRLTSPEVVYLHPDDNICVAARRLEPGAEVTVNGRKVSLREPIKLGHKLAIEPIATGKFVRKYGQIIGQATQPIEPGQWVHSHNLAQSEFERDYAKSMAVPAAPAPLAGRTFQGYRRAGGKAGTRNYIAVISSVNCSATVARQIARRFTPEVLKQFPNVDGVASFSHGGGC